MQAWWMLHAVTVGLVNVVTILQVSVGTARASISANTYVYTGPVGLLDGLGVVGQSGIVSAPPWLGLCLVPC